MPILGTSIDAIDLAEDRSRFGPLLDRLGYQAPRYATACSAEEALERAPDVGFPLLVRPSYVLGGRAMEIVYSVAGLRDYLERVGTASGAAIYLDRFLEDSIEVDVDALCDGERRVDRRDHAARRGGWDPFRRLGLRAASAHARRRDARRRSAPRPRASPARSGWSGC